MELALTYVHNYANDGNLAHRTGSSFSNVPLGIGVPLVSNSYGVEALWRMVPEIALSGWFGYICLSFYNLVITGEYVTRVNGNNEKTVKIMAANLPLLVQAE